MYPRPRTRLAGAPLVLLSLVACSAPGTAPDLLHVDSRAFAGSVLSGPLRERSPEQIDWSSSWLVEAEVSYVESAPAGERAVSGRLIVREGAREVIGTRSELAQRVQHLSPRLELETDELLWSKRVALALPAGTTVAVEGSPNPQVLHGPRAEWTRWSVETSRSAESGEGIELALVLDGRVRARVGEDDEAPTSDEVFDVREVLVLREAPAPGDEGLHLLLPAPSATAPDGAFVLRLRLHESPLEFLDQTAWKGVVDRSRAELTSSRTLASAKSTRAESEFQFEGRSALRSMRLRELRRPALVFLAETTGARLCEDLALVAGPETLGEFLTHSGRLGQESEDELEGASAFGWFLERSALEWLAARIEDEQDELEPELDGLWWRHTGELGHFPDLLREGLTRCSNSEQLEQLIVSENLLFLADSSPAARVRAFDWLEARELAPPDFDPLGERDARRAALARAQARATAEEAAATLEEVQR